MTNEKYHPAARLIHWIMALGFAFMWVCGYVMTTWVEDDSPIEELLFDLHISVGVTLLALLALRIVVRIIRSAPPLPETIRGLERIVAHLGHIALYAFPLFVIGLGWAETNFGGHTVHWFSIEMPNVFPEASENWQDWAETLHMWFAYTMLVIAVGHVGAAYKHRWIDGHDVIRRMTFSRSS